MTLRRLMLFVEVAERGNISDVAHSLYISQASVSQSIAEIEKEYNVRLFERFSKRLKLTETGQELLIYAKQLLNCEKAINDFLLQSSKKKCLHVGASLSIGDSILSDLVTKMETQDPDVEIFVTVARNAIIQEKLLTGSLDVALGDIEPQNKDIVSRPFMKDRLVLICYHGHRFWGKKSVCLNDIRDEKLVVRDSSSLTVTILEGLLLQQKIPYTISWLCTDIETSKKAVQFGHGISTISERLIQNEVARGDLWPVEIIDANMNRTFNLMYHKDKYLTHHMQTFMNLVENFEDNVTYPQK